MAAKKKSKKKIVKKKAKKKTGKKKTTKKKSAKKKTSKRIGGKKSKAVIRTEEESKNAMHGNSFWMARSSHGRKPIFKSPAQLWDGCIQYFEWVEENPLQEQKAFHAAGHISKTNINKMRAMTIQGLCIFLGISDDTWANYKKKSKGFLAICKDVESIIYNQKLTGASADLLNASIIARHLGLKDYTDVSSEDRSMSPSKELSNEDLKKELAKYGLKR